MCGIAGYTGPHVPGLLDRMLDSLAHRGPDDRGTRDDATVHIGMVRLSIIDLAGGHQPISNESGELSVVVNGEIYNYIELRQALEAKGARFRTAGDTETVLRGYEEAGAGVLDRLNGMFAIALSNARTGELFLARDRFGVKPLFYAEVPAGIVFGSEIKAVLAHPAVKRDIDPEALSHYLSLRNVPAPFTIYAGVRALPPGHTLVWRPGGHRIRRWYRQDMTAAERIPDEGQLVDQVDGLLRDSVRLRMRSDVPVGAYLSGGIDSSTITAIMSEYSPRPVETFTLAYADDLPDKADARHARLVASRYGTRHREWIMTPSDLAGDLGQIVRQLDQPFAGVITSFWLSRFMRQHVKVALSGDGADDLFASYAHHRLVDPIETYLLSGTVRDPSDAARFGYHGDQASLVRRCAALPPWEWRLAFGAFTEPEKQSLLGSAARDTVARFPTGEFLRGIYERSAPGVDRLNRMLFLDINTLLPNEILYYNDVLSMAHALEVRTPFLDYRLAELACAIPGSLKIREGTLKYILRRVAARYVPPEILDRPKEGFVLPKNVWLRGALAPIVTETLSAERLAAHDLFDVAAVGGLVRRFLAGEEVLTFRVWTLVMFQLWYDNVHRSSTAPAAARHGLPLSSARRPAG